MKITLSWLKSHLETTASLEEIAEGLNKLGLVVDEIIDRRNSLKGFQVVEIIECSPHPQADRLKICRVSTGQEQHQVICGAPNARKGLKTVLAVPGTCIPLLGTILKKGVIRGVESEGMLCSAEELQLSSLSEGIMELPVSARVGEDFATSQGYDDPVLVIEITPNRGDCLSVRGVARDLAAAGFGTLLSLKEVYAKLFLPDSLLETNSFAKVFTEETFFPNSSKSSPKIIVDSATRTQGMWCFIEGVSDIASPLWLQQRLKACGYSCMSAVVDITNYLCYDLGRPLHAFDADRVQGSVQVRYAKEGESFLALDHKTYTLQDSMVVVADDSGPIALAGVMGGASTACTPSTKRILLESAFFDPKDVASAGRLTQIHSEARHRFERFVDPQTISLGLTLASQLILRYAGGEVSALCSHYHPTVPFALSFDPCMVEKKCGFTMKPEEIEHILSQLGFEVVKNAEGYQLTVPSWRPDISIPEDIVEELVRVKGYDHLPNVPLPVKGGASSFSFVEQETVISRFLASRGLNETLTWSFIAEEQADLFATSDYEKEALRLTNPISQDLAVMRPNVLPGLIEAVGRNNAYGQDNLALFEIGPQYRNCSETGQRTVVAGLRSGTVQENHWAEKRRVVDVYDSKADILGLLEIFGIQEASIQIMEQAPSWYHPGRSGMILQGPQRVLGYFGEIHPFIQEQFSCKVPMVVFELFKEFLPLEIPKRKKLKISPYQMVERDFSFMVPLSVNAGILIKIIEKTDKELIQKIDIFDVFVPKEVEGNSTLQGKKSIGLRVKLQSFQKTLTDQEIQDFCQKAIKNVEDQTGSTLRKN